MEENGGVNACTHRCQSVSEFYCSLIFEVNFIIFTLRSKCIVIFNTLLVHAKNLFVFTKDSHL